ncbi:response regulator [Seongchinamella sediminis]|uniref:Response regulator n=1 Tax=Seongchinamella sediminis TaxID=2283635 RepID=A0A3L7DWH8_9GAMM|nr:response regulator [Seongchinamella sediminis]RLQ21486.1 response regulator [Seongchinamella sediminis]
MTTIAYVEDEDQTRQSYAESLRREGFDVVAYASKDEAIAGFRRSLPDLALLDVAHEGDRDAGYQVCAELRRISSEVPIIFLTRRHGEIDRISGLRLGADDYISKDASLEYIVIRIETLIRRLEAVRDAGVQPGSADSGELVLDDTYSTVVWQGSRVDLPLTHFWILRELCRHPGEVRSHRELMKAASIVVEPNTIAAHVKAIRQAFARLDPDFQCIRTERGRGYRWVPR